MLNYKGTFYIFLNKMYIKALKKASTYVKIFLSTI